MRLSVKPKSVKGTVLLILAIAAISFIATYSTGIAHSRSALRIGYIGNNGWGSWSGQYELLDGKMRRTLHLGGSLKNITVETQTVSGALSIEIKDKTGNVIFSQNNMESTSHSLSAEGDIVITISANQHKGSFSIQ